MRNLTILILFGLLFSQNIFSQSERKPFIGGSVFGNGFNVNYNANSYEVINHVGIGLYCGYLFNRFAIGSGIDILQAIDRHDFFFRQL
jgi:hypothetical protein